MNSQAPPLMGNLELLSTQAPSFQPLLPLDSNQMTMEDPQQVLLPGMQSNSSSTMEGMSQKRK